MSVPILLVNGVPTTFVKTIMRELIPRCQCCGRSLEGAGHCYACQPVGGYGESFKCGKCQP